MHILILSAAACLRQTQHCVTDSATEDVSARGQLALCCQVAECAYTFIETSQTGSASAFIQFLSTALVFHVQALAIVVADSDLSENWFCLSNSRIQACELGFKVAETCNTQARYGSHPEWVSPKNCL